MKHKGKDEDRDEDSDEEREDCTFRSLEDLPIGSGYAY